MNSRIKFKAYSPSIKCLVDVSSLAFLDDNRYLINNEFIVPDSDLFQHTKVGEIYEGSIVKYGGIIGIIYESKYEEAGYSIYQQLKANSTEEYILRLRKYSSLIRTFQNRNIPFMEYEPLYVFPKRYEIMGHITNREDFLKLLAS